MTAVLAVAITVVALDQIVKVMVEVENATPEPDGHNKMYMIRVDPRCTTAREAVAWTFGIERARRSFTWPGALDRVFG